MAAAATIGLTIGMNLRDKQWSVKADLGGLDPLSTDYNPFRHVTVGGVPTRGKDVSSFQAITAEASFNLNPQPDEVKLHIGAPKGFLRPGIVKEYVDQKSSQELDAMASNYRNPNGVPEWTDAAQKFVTSSTGVEGLTPYPLPGLKQLSTVVRAHVENVTGLSMADVDVITFGPGYRSSFNNLGPEPRVNVIDIRDITQEEMVDAFESAVQKSVEQGRKIVVWWQIENPMGMVLKPELQERVRNIVRANDHIVAFAEDHAYAGMSASPHDESVAAPLINDVTGSKLVVMGISTSKIVNNGGHNGGIVCGNFSEKFIKDVLNNMCSGTSRLGLDLQAYMLNDMLKNEETMRTKILDGLKTAQSLSQKFNEAGIKASCPDIGPFIVLDFNDIKDALMVSPQVWLRAHGILTLGGTSTDISELPNSPQSFEGYENMVRTAWCGLSPKEAHDVADKIIALYKGVKRSFPNETKTN